MKKNKLLKILIVSILLLSTLTTFGQQLESFQFTPERPDLRLAGFNCTSNNFNVENVYLSAEINGVNIENYIPSCTPGEKFNVTIWMNYTQNQAGSVEKARIFEIGRASCRERV